MMHTGYLTRIIGAIHYAKQILVGPIDQDEFLRVFTACVARVTIEPGTQKVDVAI